MANSTVWWLLAGAAVALELLSGTVYLLLIGIAFAAAAVSAHLGFAITVQLVVAAVVGVGAVVAWYLTHRGALMVPSEASRDLNLDVGEKTSKWKPGTPMGRPPWCHRGRSTWSSSGPARRRCPASTASSKWRAAASSSRRSESTKQGRVSVEVAAVILVIAVIFIWQSIKFVPQQNAWVRERLGKYHGTMTPGPNFLIPFIDKVAYKHSLKEIPLDVPVSQICITRDNTQLQVDGILYFQVTDPMRAGYGSSNYIVAVTQLAQTSCAA